jgi:adenylate cyclase
MLTVRAACIGGRTRSAWEEEPVAALEGNMTQSVSQPMTPPRSMICKGCWQQMHVPVPLRGVLSLPFQAFGIRPSRMNPNTCTICEMMFTRVMRARKITIDATVLFADLRGYTRLTESVSPDTVSDLLDTFYDECSHAIWQHDGLLNKTIGDAVMAVFNFPIRQDDHPRQALLAAREIQRRCKLEYANFTQLDLNGEELGVGIGLHAGQLSFGEFGRSHRDLTAIGTVVNIAARAQAAAKAGQILATRAVYDRAGSEMADSPSCDYVLKGLDAPVELYQA